MKCKWSKSKSQKRLKYISNSDYIILGSGSNIHYLSRIIKGFQVNSANAVKGLLELCSSTHHGWDIRNSSTSAVGIAESILGSFLVTILGTDGSFRIRFEYIECLEAHLNQAMIEVGESYCTCGFYKKMNSRFW
jgi:hypothetical protein